MSYNVFIGFDDRQAISYNVCQFSVVRKASFPISITPLIHEQLPIERVGLTPFTYTRFLVPFLMRFEGWALFMDCDMVANADICELWNYCDPEKAVIVADGVQPFERAAVMLFNCSHPDNLKLTPQYIETAEKLHTISWTESVGRFPEGWNHCVGYAQPKESPEIIHYTQGVPAWKKTSDCEHQDKWMHEVRLMNSATHSWDQLMGNSIHACTLWGERQPKYKTGGFNLDFDFSAKFEPSKAEDHPYSYDAKVRQLQNGA